MNYLNLIIEYLLKNAVSDIHSTTSKNTYSTRLRMKLFMSSEVIEIEIANSFINNREKVMDLLESNNLIQEIENHRSTVSHLRILATGHIDEVYD